jgi:hypothetical protein
MQTLKNIPVTEFASIRTDENKLKTVARLDGFGHRIPNSRYFRTFCIDCHTPMRVRMDDLDRPIRCEECDPKHVRCTSPHTGLDGLDKDVDAFSPSWKCA